MTETDKITDKIMDAAGCPDGISVKALRKAMKMMSELNLNWSESELDTMARAMTNPADL